MPSATNKTAAIAARVEAYSQYRDTLIAYLFVSKALRYLTQIENLGSMPAEARKPFEDRMQRLTNRRTTLGAALAHFMNNPLIDHHSAKSRSTYTGHAYGNSYGAAGRSTFAADEDEMSWSAPTPPMTNVNGLPMAGHVDIHGNPYGSTGFDNNGL